jgi:hypothetical protein
MPVNVTEGAHTLKGLIERPGGQSLHVVDVACDEDMPNTVLVSKFTQAGYHPEACLLQKPHRCVVDKSKHLSNLPV